MSYIQSHKFCKCYKIQPIQLDEELRGGVLDTPAFKDAAFGVEDAKNAVWVDSASPSPCGQPAAVCLATLGYGSRFR
jgi:hypothetical protein